MQTNPIGTFNSLSLTPDKSIIVGWKMVVELRSLSLSLAHFWQRLETRQLSHMITAAAQWYELSADALTV